MRTASAHCSFFAARRFSECGENSMARQRQVIVKDAERMVMMARLAENLAASWLPVVCGTTTDQTPCDLGHGSI